MKKFEKRCKCNGYAIFSPGVY